MVIVINVLVEQIPGKLDLTKNKIYSLSDETYKLLDSLKTDITITIIGKTGSEDPTVKTILGKYAAHGGHIKLQTMDPDMNPGWSKQFDTSGQGLGPGSGHRGRGLPGGRAIIPSQIAPAHLIASPYARQAIPYNPSALAKAASALPSSERDITLAYDTGAPDDQLIAEQIGAELQAAGITAKVVGQETSSIYGAVGSVSTAKSAAAPNVLVDYFWPDADNPYTWAHINYDPSGGLEYEACNVPGIASLDSQAAATGNLSIYNQVTNLVQQSGCWLNVADKNETMVVQPWLQGVAAAHVVAAPEMLLLAKLYPK